MDANQLLAEVRQSGMTQVEVAEAIGISQGSISKLERGQTHDLKTSTYLKLVELHRVRAGVPEEAKPDIVPKVTKTTAAAVNLVPTGQESERV